MSAIDPDHRIPTDILTGLPKPPEKQTLRYNCVYIVEWLHDSDRKTGKELQEYLHTRNPELSAQLYAAKSKSDVMTSLREIAENVEKNNEFPMLQIEAHGGRTGLGYYGPDGFSGQELLRWEEIRDLLALINKASQANLIVFSAACWGHAALLAAAGGPLPFMAIAGPTDSVDESALLKATKEFYRGALTTDSNTPTFQFVVESSAREIGNADDLAWDSMVRMTYEALGPVNTSEARQRSGQN